MLGHFVFRSLTSRGVWRPIILAVALPLLVSALFPLLIGPARADSADSEASSYGRYEAWAGVDAARHQWLAYTGTTAAPWSHDIYSDGWRIRFDGGYGGYSYDQVLPTTRNCGGIGLDPSCPKDAPHIRNKVERSYFDALVGYYLKLGDVTAKIFAGATMSSHKHLVPDPNSSLEGTQFGGKAALELWWDATPSAWTSLDISYATTFDERSARWRAGWRITPSVSIGPELRYDSNLGGDGDWMSKAGLFARYAWTGGEVSLAGGVATTHSDRDGDSSSPYGTVNVLFQF